MSTQDDRTVQPFAAALQEVGGGRAHTRVSDLLHQCTQAVVDTGKKATLTITVTVAPYKKGNTNTLDVTVTSQARLPEGDEATVSGIFFPTADGNLTRHDPNQLQLPLRSVGDNTGRNTA